MIGEANTSQMLRSGMSTIRLDWNDAQAEKVDAGIVQPMASRVGRLSAELDSAITAINNAKEDL